MGWQDDPVVGQSSVPSWASDPVVAPPTESSRLADIAHAMQGTPEDQRNAGLGRRAILEGITSLPRMVDDAAGSAINLGSHGINAVAGTHIPDIQSSSDQLSQYLDSKGLPRPETGGERLSSGIVSGLSGSGAGIGIGGLLQKLPGLAGLAGEFLSANPATQATSAVTAPAAAEVTREAGGGSGAQTLASLIGGIAGGSLAGGAPNIVKAAFGGGNPDALTQNIENFRAAGTTPTVGQATQSRVNQVTESGLSALPSSGGVMTNTATNQAEQIGNRLKGIADSLAPNVDETKAGLAIKKGVTQGFVPAQKGTVGSLYDALDALIPQGTIVPGTNILDAIKRITTPIAGAENTSALLQTPKIGAIGTALANDAAPTAGKPILSSIVDASGKPIVTGETLAQPGGLPYEALKQLRTTIGEKLSNPSLTDDIPTGQYKQLYTALSSDMEDAATQAGPDATQAFNRANNFYGANQRRLDALDNVISQNGGGEAVFKAATSGTARGATTLQTVMKSLAPEDQKTLTAAVIRRMGRSNPNDQNAEGDVFSAGKFLTDFNNLSPRAQSVLFGGQGPQLQSDMRKIAAVAKNIKGGSKVFANPSGTAARDNLLRTSGAMILAVLTGNLPVIAGTAGIGVATNLTARLMTNPKFVSWLAKSTDVPIGQFPATIQQLSGIAQNSGDPDIAAAVELLKSAPQQGQQDKGGTQDAQSP